jgi:hypothetical protein
METAGTPPQERVLAMSVKGEVTCAPFTGLLTVMLVVVAVVEPTAMFSSTWPLVPFPQHFT